MKEINDFIETQRKEGKNIIHIESYRLYETFVFNDVDENTDLIIINFHHQKDETLNQISNLLSAELMYINKRGCYPKIIKRPPVIIYSY